VTTDLVQRDFHENLQRVLSELEPLPEELALFGARSMDDLGVDEKIDVLELALIRHPEVVDLPLTHRWTPGLYIRELRAPAGVLATTYIHRHEHPFVCSQGEVSVWDGERVVRVRAPFTGITKAGTRRVCFVHEACVWTNFIPMAEKLPIRELEEKIFDCRTLPDGTNVRDRFRAALGRRSLAEHQRMLEAVIGPESLARRAA